MEKKLREAAAALPESGLRFADIGEPARSKREGNHFLRRLVAVAACIAVVVVAGIGIYGYTVEAKEYRAAVAFFETHGLTTEGLSREDIKVVYRDISTQSFSYSKTAEVLENSLTEEQLQGYGIWQEDPTPEDVENLWNYRNSDIADTGGIRYRSDSEYRFDPAVGYEVRTQSFVEKYNGDTLLWRVPVSKFWIEKCVPVSDGVIAYGHNDRRSGQETLYSWLVKVDSSGNLCWKRMLDNGFTHEYIGAVLENTDGSYSVISRGDSKNICLNSVSPAGEVALLKKTEVGNYGIQNAVGCSDGYIIQLISHMTNEHAKIIKMDRQGNITDAFSYGGGDSYYYITDMLEFSGKIYLSAYAVPRLENEEENAGGRYEIAAIMNEIYDNNRLDISDEELTAMVRAHYTAVLLVCDLAAGTPKEFYSVPGSLGGPLSLADGGALLWDVESIATTVYSPYTSAFSIKGSCVVHEYTFDTEGKLISGEKTDRVAYYWR